MLNLQLLQRQRARLYKNDLRRQFEYKQQMRKNQSMQLKSRDQQQLKQRIQIAMKEIKYQKQREFHLNSKLKEENLMLASIRNMNKEVQQTVKKQIPLKGSSLLQTLYKKEERRGNQTKNIAKKLSHQNHQQENFHKMNSKEIKNYEIVEDQRHMERLKQIQALRKQQNEEIRNRYSPEPKVGQVHKKLQDLNEQYRRSLESFAYNGRDILDVLKRDDSKQTYEKNRRVQSELKNQMQEKKMKDQISKQQYVGQTEDLKKSILGSVLFKDSNFDKRQYGNYLIKQKNQIDSRRSIQKIESKQKVQIGSIFGGQGGPQRLKMIKYIDHNLGIQSQYLKNLQPGNKSSSPYRIKNLYEFNGQVPLNSSRMQQQDKQRQIIQNPQKLYTQIVQRNDQKQKKPQSSNEHTIRLSSSRLGEQSPKSYFGYDLIKGSQVRYQV